MSSFPPEDPAPDVPARSRRRRRRWWIVALLSLLALIAWVGITLALAAGPLRSGRGELEGARRALLHGDLATAGERFDAAAEDFGSARDQASWGPGFIPFVGNTTDAVVAIAEAGAHLGEAGSDLAAGLGALPGGLDALLPADGVLPLDAYRGLAGVVATARDEAAAAAAAVTAAPDVYLPGPVAQARWDAEEQTAQLATTLDAVAGLVDGLPGFAGADRTTRYLVLASNPAELRGTGGLWGAYAILTFRQGQIELSDAAPTNTLPKLRVDQIDGVNPTYRELYDRWGGASSWLNMNMTPDFPSAAEAAIANLSAGGGPEVDGVIATDPFTMRSFLQVTGSVTVPGSNYRVNAENVVDFTTNQAYGIFPDAHEERKEILGVVASHVLDTFLSMKGEGLARLRALGEATSDGHLMVYSTDASFQEALERIGAAGSFERPAGADLVSVTVNNGSANKVDYYAERDIRLAVELGGDHEARGAMDVTIENLAPTDGAPAYVLGPVLDELGPGDQYPLISAWCPEPCELLEATRDGQPTLVNTGVENGMTFFRDYRPIGAGEAGAFGVTWATRDVWSGQAWDGRYRLHIAGQTTIVPTTMSITVVAPPGSAIVWTSEPMTVDGGTATWEGTPTHETVIEVRFRASLPTRWWRTLTQN